MAFRTFTRAAGNSTFKCSVCDHMTRITSQPTGCDMCAICWELAGIENTVYDDCFDASVAKDARHYLAMLSKRGGNVEKVKRNFSHLMAALEGAV